MYQYVAHNASYFANLILGERLVDFARFSARVLSFLLQFYISVCKGTDFFSNTTKIRKEILRQEAYLENLHLGSRLGAFLGNH